MHKYLLKRLPYIQRMDVGQRKTVDPRSSKASLKSGSSPRPDWTEEGLTVGPAFLDTAHGGSVPSYTCRTLLDCCKAGQGCSVFRSVDLR